MNTCSICKRKDRAKIEAAAIEGKSLRDIARQYDVGFHSVSRHVKKCLPPVAPQVAAHIARQTETSVASVREVLEILSFQARADTTDLYGPDGSFDIVDIRKRGLGKMIKSLTFKREANGTTVVDVVKAEAYSAQGAAQALLNAYTKLEITKQLTDAKLLTERERNERLASIFDRAKGRAEQARGRKVGG
jgi:hypothetical protein